MAIDPNISLMGRGADIGSAIRSGAETGEMLRTSDIRQQILEQQSQAQAMNLAQTRGQYMNQLATGLMNKPLDQRAAIVAQQMPFMQQMGINPADILSQDLTDQGLSAVVTQTQPFMQQAGSGGFQFGATQTVQKDDGSLVSVTQVRDPSSGGVRVVEVPIEGQLVSGIGETAEERKQREIETAVEKTGQVGEVETDVLVGREEALRPEEVKTAEAMVDVDIEKQRRLAELELDRELAATDMKDFNVRRKTFINQGVAAKQTIPNINRMIELNDRIITGGATALTKAVTDFLGMTSADIGEFNRRSSELVLGTIRQLGANPTEGERAFLEKIQPSVGQSNEVNSAILADLKLIADRQSKRAEKLQEDKSLDPNELILQEPEFIPKFGQPQAKTQPTPKSKTTGGFDNASYIDSLF